MMVIITILMVAMNVNIHALKIVKFVKEVTVLNVIRTFLWTNINYVEQNRSNLNLVNKRIVQRLQVLFIWFS